MLTRSLRPFHLFAWNHHEARSRILAEDSWGPPEAVQWPGTRAAQSYPQAGPERGLRLSFPHSDLYGILYVNVIIDNYRHTRKEYWQFMSELIPCDGIVEHNKFWRHNFFLE